MRSLTLAAVVAGCSAAMAAAPYTCTEVQPDSLVIVNSVSDGWACAQIENVLEGRNTNFTIRNLARSWTGTQMQVIFHNPSSQVSAASSGVAPFNFAANDGVLGIQTPGLESTADNPAGPASWNSDGYGWHQAFTSFNQDDSATRVPVFYAASGIFGSDGEDDACTGDYRVVVDLTSRSDAAQRIPELQVLYRVVERSNPADLTSDFPTLPGIGGTVSAGQSVSSGSTFTATNVALPGDKVSLKVDEAFAMQKYMIKNATFMISSERTNIVANQSDWTPSWAGGFAPNSALYQVPTVWTPSTNKVTYTQRFVDYAPADQAEALTQGGAVIQVPEMSSAASRLKPIAWDKTTGPFLDFTVAFQFNEYECIYDYAVNGDFPSDQTQSMLDVRDDIDQDSLDYMDRQIFMVKLPARWWNFTAFPDYVVDVDSALPRESQTVAEARRELDLKWLAVQDTSTRQSSDLTDFAAFQDQRRQSTYQSGVYQFNSGDYRLSTVVETAEVGPVDLLKDYVAFVSVQRGSCLRNVVLFGLQGAMKQIQGECESYADCIKDRSRKHPAHDRRGNSANADASRFTHCGIHASMGGDDIVPVARCYECMDDSDCGEEQFCNSVDNGIETANGVGTYIADAYAHERYGLCVEKSKDVLGARCRTDTAEAYDKDAITQGMFNVQNGGSTKHFGNGYGFCGEASFFNSTGVNSQYLVDGNVFRQEGLVRKVWWTGVCFDGTCQECVNVPEGDSAGAGLPSGRQCINGRTLNRVVVDNTLRTFLQNTTSGTVLAGVMMTVLLIFCFAIGLLADANRNREYYGQDPVSTCEMFTSLVCFLPCCWSRSSRAELSRRRWTGVDEGAGEQLNPIQTQAVRAA